MICVVVLQNGVDIQGETDSCSEAHRDDGSAEVTIKDENAINITEELTIKVEDAIDKKNEIPEAIIFPRIETEQEVRLSGVCKVVAAYVLRAFVASKKENVKLHLTICCFVLYSLCHIPF